MTKRIPQPRSELSPSVRAHEAKLLAVMLRTSRLTLVFAEPGADKGALLKSGLMPLLQRRQGDRGTTPAAAATTIVAQDRRRTARPRAEVAIHFDDWKQAPLSDLKRRIMGVIPAAAAEAADAGLAVMLGQLHQRLGLHFVFVLDRFEQYLAMAPDEGEVGEFANELVEAILHDGLPASFLVAMDEIAKPRLERFRARIPGFDHDVLRLSPVAERPEATPMPHRPAAPAATPAAPARRASPRVPIKVEDVYALIESTLSRSRAIEPSANWQCDVELDLSDASTALPLEGSAPVGPRKVR